MTSFTSCFSVVGLARTVSNAGLSLFSIHPRQRRGILHIIPMDPSAGSRPPTPVGPCTRASTQKATWLTTPSPSPGAAPHQTAILQATSNTCPPPPSLAATTSLPPGSTGSFDPFHDDKDDEDTKSSPVLLSSTGCIGDMPATDVITDLIATASDVTTASAGATALAMTAPTLAMAGTASDVSLILPAVNAAIQAALQEQTAHLEQFVTAAMEGHLATLNTCFRSLQEEVKSNHGHVMKQLIQPLEDRVTALKNQTNELGDRLTAKGAALLEKTEQLAETISTLEATVESATKDFEFWLSALESREAPPAMPGNN